MSNYKQGETFEVMAPFLWHQVDVLGWDGPIPEVKTVECWRPGFLSDTDGYSSWFECHGIGDVIFTVVDFHRLPAPYPARVFYTRKFRDPDGKVFGNNKLRIMSAPHFTRMIRQRAWPSNDIEDVEDVGKPEFKAERQSPLP